MNSTAAPRPVAHVTAPGAFGGLERVVAGLTSGLVAQGEQVVVVAVLEPGVPVPAFLDDLRVQGVVVEVLHVGARSYLAERRAVRNVLARHGVRVVHTHGYRADLLHGGVARRDGRGTVSTVHGFTGSGRKGRVYEWLQARALRRFDAVIAVSMPLVETLTQAGVRRDRVQLIPNSLAGSATVPLERAEARRALGLAPDGALIGWVGRMSHEKDPELAIEAFALVRAPGARLCFVGDGPMMAPCRTRAEALGLTERVHFAGAVSDASRLLGAFDVLALSSRTEGTPMVLLEAGIAGLPIVATRVGGVPDLLQEDGGTLVPPRDAQALAAALDDALAEPERAHRAAVALRERITSPAASEDWIAAHQRVYDAVARTRATPTLAAPKNASSGSRRDAPATSE